MTSVNGRTRARKDVVGRGSRLLLSSRLRGCPSCFFGLVLALSILTITVQGQRVKIGCYEAEPIQCLDSWNLILEESGDANFQEVENTCLRLATEVFNSSNVYWDTERHPEFLDSIESTNPFCSKVREAYTLCTFCAPIDEDGTNWRHIVERFCEDAVTFFDCGNEDKLSMDEILSRNDEFYSVFQTAADINETCEAIAPVYYDPFDIGYGKLPSLGMEKHPLSFDFCTRMAAGKHLCPGVCDGGCFTEEYPPSCQDADVNNSFLLEPWSENQTMEEVLDFVCNEIQNRAFAGWNVLNIFNVSSHLPYLQAISEDEEYFCPAARAAYPHCVWCNNDDLCFNEQYPMSCETPPTRVDVFWDPRICITIESSSFGIWDSDFFLLEQNEAINPGSIAIHATSSKCAPARQYSHQCLWCRPKDMPKKFVDMCINNINYCTDLGEVAESEWNDFIRWLREEPRLLREPQALRSNISDALLTLDDPTDYCKRFNANNGTSYDHFWAFGYADNLSVEGCVQKLLLAKMCPRQFCPQTEPIVLDNGYLGATTTAQKKALIWLCRVSAALSLCGASFVLYSALSDPEARKTVYHQLLAGMACFDMCTALSWVFATAPIDVSKPEGARIHGAIGNNASCKAQGFFIQLGLTSIFYAMSLAFYYYLVIARGWKEFQLKKILPFLHGIPLFVGFTLSFAAIPEYSLIVYVCHLEPPSSNGTGGEMWPVLVYFVVPLSIAIVSITGCMIMTYCSVRKRAGAARKWTLGVGNATKMQQAVFWQALFYVMVFYITWPILFAVYLASVDEEGPYQLTLLIAILAPLQGALNASVYARPRILHYFDNRTKMRKIAKEQRLRNREQQHEGQHVQQNDESQRPRRSSAIDQLKSAIYFLSPFHSYNNAGDLVQTPSIDPSVAAASGHLDMMMEDSKDHAGITSTPLPHMDAISESLGEDGQADEIAFVNRAEGELIAPIMNDVLTPYNDNADIDRNNEVPRDEKESSLTNLVGPGITSNTRSNGIHADPEYCANDVSVEIAMGSDNVHQHNNET